MTETFIPVNTPLLDGNEAEYLAECIRTGWISSEGPFVKRFEEAMADVAGRRHGIAVTNGSVALEHRYREWSSSLTWHTVARKYAVDAMRLEPPTPGYSVIDFHTAHEWRNDANLPLA